jgi:hypothetical protein
MQSPTHTFSVAERRFFHDRRVFSTVVEGFVACWRGLLARGMRFLIDLLRLIKPYPESYGPRSKRWFAYINVDPDLRFEILKSSVA